MSERAAKRLSGLQRLILNHLLQSTLKAEQEEARGEPQNGLVTVWRLSPVQPNPARRRSTSAVWSRTLRRLEKRGLVTRGSGRPPWLRLTPLGREVADKLREAANRPPSHG